MDSDYLSIFTLAERLHRQFLDVIQLELDRRNIRDLNAVRALILLNLADTEMTVSELVWRGCYLGSNVSYNLKKLTESGYVIQDRSAHDKRVTMVKNSPKAMDLVASLMEMTARHADALLSGAVRDGDLHACRTTLERVQGFLTQLAEPNAAVASIRAAA